MKKITNKTELSVIEKQITPVIKEVESLFIKDKETLTQATEYLSQANKYLDAIEKDRKALTDPINASLKAIRAKYKPLETALEALVGTLRDKMGKYQTNLLKARTEAELSIAGRVGEGKGHLKLETAVAKIENLETVDSNIEAETGSVKFKTVKDFEIVDINKIPIFYLCVDEDKIKEALKAGTEVTGVRFFTRQVAVNSR